MRQPRLLIPAGPTHEPIDAVRFLGNRSSGRLGVALADEAARRGWSVTLLLGPTPLRPSENGIELVKYRSCADLEARLGEQLHQHEILVMAAAVSDYRPVAGQADPFGKRRRDADRMTIEFERTPDLLAGCSARRKPGQMLVGFALEPRSRMLESAREKLERKGIDLIVANPLETMESETIDATLLATGEDEPIATTGCGIDKPAFAAWLLDRIEEAREANARKGGARRDAATA
ncbi:MAG: hypothetical protein CMJ31_09890 [Phycisphaerae bacterium]|nr:hypothetical protein [Phycisphaerae bacterium]